MCNLSYLGLRRAFESLGLVYLRRLVLVLFNSEPANLLHDGLGLVVFFLYCCCHYALRL